jgi:urease accessory protein
MFGAYGAVPAATSVAFVAPAASRTGWRRAWRCRGGLVPVADTRRRGKADLPLNDALPRIEVSRTRSPVPRRRRGVRAATGHRTAHGPALLPVLMSLATLLLLADGRLPSGGHAHSGGVEAAVGAGRVHDLPTLAAFLRGRLATAGLVAAAFAAAAASSPPIRQDRWAELDAGLDARTPSPASAPGLPGAGPGPAARRPCHVDGDRDCRPIPHHPVALGAIAAAAGLAPVAGRAGGGVGTVTGRPRRRVRLWHSTPNPVQGVLAAVAATATVPRKPPPPLAHSRCGRSAAAGAPLLDIAAEGPRDLGGTALCIWTFLITRIPTRPWIHIRPFRTVVGHAGRHRRAGRLGQDRARRRAVPRAVRRAEHGRS